MIIDTHLHVIDQSALRYPWLAGAPALNRDFSYQDYAREARRCGIEATLHMEVDVAAADIEAETDYVGALSRAGGQPDRSAPSPPAGPRMPVSPPIWSGSRSNPVVKGFRRVLHVMPDELVGKRAVPREHRSCCPAPASPSTWSCCRTRSRKAIALADLAPDVQFILDHCGVPDIKDGAEHPWREQMTEIARRPNVAGKISGVVAYADAGQLDGGDAAALCRAHDRRLRLGPRRLGQRLAGLHAGRRPLHLDRRHPRAHRRRQRRRAGEAAVGKCEADLEAAVNEIELAAGFTLPAIAEPSLTKVSATLTLARPCSQNSRETAGSDRRPPAPHHASRQALR